MARLWSRCVRTSSGLSRIETVNVGSYNKNLSPAQTSLVRKGPVLGELLLTAQDISAVSLPRSTGW